VTSTLIVMGFVALAVIVYLIWYDATHDDWP